jgi:TPR repeat protein
MALVGFLLIDTDHAEAVRLWERAAAMGLADAMRNLGVESMQRDPAVARKWWEQAAQRGDGASMSHLGYLLGDSDPDLSDQ